MYNKYSMNATEFIDDSEIRETLDWAEANKNNLSLVYETIEKTGKLKGLSHREAALLLACEDEEALKRIFEKATEIKQAF